MTAAEGDRKRRLQQEKLRAKIPVLLKRAKDLSREMERILELLSASSGETTVSCAGPLERLPPGL